LIKPSSVSWKQRRALSYYGRNIRLRPKRGSDTGALSERNNEPNAVIGPADLVVGTYVGDVISDAKGSSRTHIIVTVTNTWRIDGTCGV
jgi:hypothetical protein